MLPAPSSLQLRDELEQLALKDLLGPAGGENEYVDERFVRGRYILGLLAPKGANALPEEDEDEIAEGGIDSQDGKPASRSSSLPATLPSSFGLTFAVEAATAQLEVTAQWGQYKRERNQSVTDNKGDSKLVWQRHPRQGTIKIEIKEGRIKAQSPCPEQEEVKITGLVRKRDDAWTVTLYLLNTQTEPKELRDQAWLFQAELVVRDPNSKPVFLKRALPPELAPSDIEDRAMAMLYRRELEFVVGHGVGAHAELVKGQWDRAIEVRTSAAPTYSVERMDAPTAEDIPALANVVVDMKTLAEMPDAEFANAFTSLADAYEKWIIEQEASLKNSAPDLDLYRLDAENNLKNCRTTLARIRDGISLISSNALAAKAFRFANRAMWQQRIRTIFSRDVRQSGSADLTQIDQPRNRSWRPFQLAFILLNLRGLVDPTHPDRSDPNPLSAKADLLWFPTGGGKTEAYLGVTAFTLGLRRLINAPRNGAGVAVLMRYTLRLLTLQQFQRATALLCACEMIRREDPTQWGDEPFRVGLWVGQKSTPNWTADAEDVIKQLRQGGPPSGKGTPVQLTNCPWCGKPIKAGSDVEVEKYAQGRGRTIQYCSDPLGECPFSRKQSNDEGLPVLVVDEEIYRRLPALLIATVDKFAQMPWRGETQMLFGRVNGYCPRHGYRSPGVEDADSHPKKGNFSSCKTESISPLRPPDLIIQDELHLISGPLGTLVGLYETAVDHLASWQLDGHTIRPKVIASTATIRRAKSQVNGLFLRDVQIFPPSALNADDNFFSRRRASATDSPGRRYIGLCAPGTRFKTVLIRVYVAYMSAAQVLYQKYGTRADPWMTAIGYFNSLRELGGMRRVVEDSVRTLLRRMDQRGLAVRRIEPWTIEELTSRKTAADIPRTLDRLEAVFDPKSEQDRQDKRKAGESTDFSKVPFDVVLATNMISVGVDVGRLGLMIVGGQPKATAEYIQATSRVGRTSQGPGLVCMVYNWSRPRDLSHYERFEHYHATFYQHVEALSVTPFSSRALDRGLTALLVSYLRLLGVNFNANDRAGQLVRQHQFVDEAIRNISNRAKLVTATPGLEILVKQMLEVRLDAWLTRKETTQTGGGVLGYKQLDDGRTLGLLKDPPEKDIFTCLNSLRDVEPPVKLVLNDYNMDTVRPNREANSGEGQGAA